jgi:hypothetical protein
MKNNLCFTILIGTLIGESSFAQGPLDPPPGNPQPEMRSLQDLWDSIESLHAETSDFQLDTQELAATSLQILQSNSATLESAERTRVVLQRLAEDLGRSPDWVETPVDTSGNTGLQPSLVIQDNGAPAIAYRNLGGASDELTWASLAQGVWDTEIVDPSSDDTGQYASAGIAPGGTPMIAYYNETDTSLMFAERDGGTWTTETVDPFLDSGKHASFAYASGLFGRPSIAYYSSRTGGSLMYVRRLIQISPPAEIWGAPETVDSSGDVGTFASLQFRNDRTPAIAYFDATNGDLKYAEKDSGGTWNISTVDDGNGNVVGENCAMRIRSNGNPVIVYQDSTAARIKLAEWNGASWKISNITEPAISGDQFGLALNARDEPLICWSTLGAVGYAERLSGEWLRGNVGSNTRTPDIAFLPDGRPAVVWYAATTDSLSYAELRSFSFR